MAVVSEIWSVKVGTANDPYLEENIWQAKC